VVYFAKVIFFCEAFAMAGLLFATLIRNQVGTIAALIILPDTIEGLLSLLLRQNSVYMPFTALQQVIAAPAASLGRNVSVSATGYLSPPKAAGVYMAYLVGVWIVAWYLFIRRDAN
jgi:hypothetical protein